MMTATRLAALLLTLTLAPLAAASEPETSDDAPARVLPESALQGRFLQDVEFTRFTVETGFDVDALTSCRDADVEAGRRQRVVTNTVPFTLFVLEDGSVYVRYDGDDDEDGEIQECLLEKLDDMELGTAPDSMAGSRYRHMWYDSTFRPQRRMRHGEIIALYTLSGVSAGVAIGSFVAARADDREADERVVGVAGSPAVTHIEQRPDRFRAAGWSMLGVSLASFVGGTLLYTSNRDIENRENPVLVVSPGSPTGGLGFTLSGRF